MVGNCQGERGTCPSGTKKVLSIVVGLNSLVEVNSIFTNGLEGTYCFFCRVSTEGSETCYIIWRTKENYV